MASGVCPRDDSGGWRPRGTAEAAGLRRGQETPAHGESQAAEGGAADCRLLTLAAEDTISKGGLCGGPAPQAPAQRAGMTAAPSAPTLSLQRL